jgi:HPt (histidine-containing phosphotransfer) domain-containing protein
MMTHNLSNNSSKSSINIDFIKDAISTDTSVIIEIFTLFIEMSKDYQSNMDLAIPNHDFEASFQIAHSFGSSCKMLGLDDLYEFVKEVETESISKTDFETIISNHTKVKALLTVIIPEIIELIPQLKD